MQITLLSYKGGFVQLDLIYIKKRYQDFLKPYCNEHMIFDKEEFKRPFVGIVLTGVFETDFFVPLTTKHTNKPLPQAETFEIKSGTNSIHNFNLIIPVPKSEQIDIHINNLKNVEMRRILQEQLREIVKNQDIISFRAINTYINVLDNPNSKLAKRSNDFLLLEKKAIEWETAHPSKKNTYSHNVDESSEVYKNLQEKLGEEKLSAIINPPTR